MTDILRNILGNSIFQGPKDDGAQLVDAKTEDLSGMEGFSIDEYRPMNVAVIGAGFSGILAGIRLRQHIPNLEMTIYEKNAGVGGTWYSNKYPGIKCDVPSHAYAYSFEHKGDWSSFYSPGPEILEYLNHVVDKWALRPHIKLRHELVHAKWDDPSGKWHLRIRRSTGESDEEFEDTADVVINGVGSLSRWRWPNITGLHDFKGTLVHSGNWNLGGATWEEDVAGWGDKRVAVIGVGSSALQIVPALQPKVKKLYNLVRGKTWVAPVLTLPVYSRLVGREVTLSDLSLNEDEKKALVDNPEKLLEWRHVLEHELNANHQLTLPDSEVQKFARNFITEHMKKQLEKKPWIAEKLIPDFPVSVRRLSPASGYLEALCEDNCDFISENITRATPTGLEFADGKHVDLDVIICATGFDTSWRLPFGVTGRNGVELKDKWSPYPRTYLSVCTDGFPNMFFAGGPNSLVGTTSLIAMIEHQTEYAVMATMKLQRERLKSIEPKREAVADFDSIVETYFKRTVFSHPIATWYNVGIAGGRVSAVWPGSNLHCLRALKYPRWEDFNYERADKTNNGLFWLGDGMSYNEKTRTGDRSWYLNADYVDVPPVPQSSRAE